VHAVETLYAILEPGCESVSRIYTQNSDVVTGRWKDGRIGTVRLVRPYSDYGAVVFGGKQAAVSNPKSGAADYTPLVAEIVKFFQTGKPPVPPEETLEMFAFMDAAERSKDQGGRPVPLR
jgi:hypothetical protein